MSGRGPLAGGVTYTFCSVAQLPGEGHLFASQLGKQVREEEPERTGADWEGTWKGTCVRHGAGWKESTPEGLGEGYGMAQYALSGIP